jgi:hypothetical protein
MGVSFYSDAGSRPYRPYRAISRAQILGLSKNTAFPNMAVVGILANNTDSPGNQRFMLQARTPATAVDGIDYLFGQPPIHLSFLRNDLLKQIISY